MGASPKEGWDHTGRLKRKRDAQAICHRVCSGSWFTHGVIPGSSHTQALGISSPGIDEAHLMGSYIMERRNGTLCRTGRVVEADCDLHH